MPFILGLGQYHRQDSPATLERLVLPREPEDAPFPSVVLRVSRRRGLIDIEYRSIGNLVLPPAKLFDRRSDIGIPRLGIIYRQAHYSSSESALDIGESGTVIL